MADQDTDTKPAKHQFDLAKAILDKVEEIGPEQAAVFFKKTPSTIAKWKNGVAPDITAAQIILNEALAGKKVKIPTPTAATAAPTEAPAAPEVQIQGETIPEPFDNGQEPIRRTTLGGDTDGPPQGIEPLRSMEKAKKLAMIMPTNRDIAPAVVMSVLGNWKATLPPEIQEMLAPFHMEHDTLIHRARNILATRFLASGHEWSFWMDSDVIAPIGNPAWFKRRTGTQHHDKWFLQAAINRLTTRNRSIVGAVYTQRSNGGRVIAQPGLAPKTEGEKDSMNDLKTTGPREELMQVDWVGFGCVAIHRKVFEDILRTQPNVAAKKDGEPHGFFTAFEDGPQGEDVAFCKRALLAGHPSFLDLSVFCAHVGKFAFMP